MTSSARLANHSVTSHYLEGKAINLKFNYLNYNLKKIYIIIINLINLKFNYFQFNLKLN